jgi:hypothetical protein
MEEDGLVSGGLVGRIFQKKGEKGYKNFLDDFGWG